MTDEAKLEALQELVNARLEYLDAAKIAESTIKIEVCHQDRGIQIMERGASGLMDFLGKEPEKVYDTDEHICYGFYWQDTLFYWLEEK